MQPAQRSSGHGILSLTIRDKAVLYAAYMPFIRNGGLFIPTSRPFVPGDEVFMLLRLLEDPEKLPIAGTVVWMTPRRAQGNRAMGIGVQFNDPEHRARNRIETLLAGMLGSDKMTHTL
ncbi:MAG: PilZ domain-containing protein [Pseudomonadales bacterium]|nr:PilZ domain-containing protein [Pseudomonadales bacterium]